MVTAAQRPPRNSHLVCYLGQAGNTGPLRMIRPLFLVAAATAIAAFSSTGHAQQRTAQSRDDLLDALTRHIQICSEISDSQGRLACFDKLQTQVGGVQPGPATPTPLRPGTGGAPTIV